MKKSNTEFVIIFCEWGMDVLTGLSSSDETQGWDFFQFLKK